MVGLGGLVWFEGAGGSGGFPEEAMLWKEEEVFKGSAVKSSKLF